MADVQLAFPGQQRQGQGMLVIIRDQPSLDGIGNGFPPLVVLVKDMYLKEKLIITMRIMSLRNMSIGSLGKAEEEM